MCGIFGITGNRNNAKKEVFEGLKRLEYRGYDSWGIAIISENKKTESKKKSNVKIEKKTGKVTEAILDFENAFEALGHTRWASHGKVTKRNSHPHKFGKITIVHNGIFENYLDYKKKAIKEGVKFNSETDSEVLAFLINKYLLESNDIKKSILKLIKNVKGRYSFLFIVDGQKGIWAVQKGSPLILGLDKKTTYIASDTLAFLKKTNKVIHLKNGEAVFIHKSKRDFFDLKKGSKIIKKAIKINSNLENTKKGNFKHFMLKEIFEQKKIMAKALEQDRKKVLKFKKMIAEAENIYILGSGTAHKVALMGEYFFAENMSINVKAVASSEMIFFKKLIKKNDLIIAISQSGETADVLEITKSLKNKKVNLVAICNTETSSLVADSDLYFLLNSGPEIAVASTKATTAQMLILNLLLSKNIRKMKQSFIQEISMMNFLFSSNYQKEIKKVVKNLKNYQDIFIIGRGKFYPIALESAIKIQEVSYLNAQAFASGELKHGPIAMIKKNTPVIVLGSDSETILSATEIKSRGGKIIGISSEDNFELYDFWIKVPKLKFLSEIITLIPVQLIAYYLAISKKINPDKPRNLAKSVTVK